jgi:hypothetical protein
MSASPPKEDIGYAGGAGANSGGVLLSETVRFRVAGMISARRRIALIFGLPTPRTVRTTLLIRTVVQIGEFKGSSPTTRRAHRGTE